MHAWRAYLLYVGINALPPHYLRSPVLLGAQVDVHSSSPISRDARDAEKGHGQGHGHQWGVRIDDIQVLYGTDDET
jgi:hypothetical protein